MDRDINEVGLVPSFQSFFFSFIVSFLSLFILLFYRDSHVLKVNCFARDYLPKMEHAYKNAQQ